MVNMKDISEVPLLEQLTGKENVLLNDSGSAKQTSIEILFAETSKALANANKKLEESAKMIEDLNKKIEEMEKLDIDIVVRGTYEPVEDRMVLDIEVNKMLTFEELKQKILAGVPLKIKTHLFSQNWEASTDDPYCVGFNNDCRYTYYPAGFWNDDDPEFIPLEISGGGIMVGFFIEANGELVLAHFNFD